MYYQRILLNIFKCAQAFEKSSCTVINVCLLNMKKSTFFNRRLCFSVQFRKIKNSCKLLCKHSLKCNAFVLSGSFLFNLFKPEEEKDDIEELRMSIKHSILLIQKEEFSKAEQMLHIALRQAQILQHYDGITYVYDVMANLAYDMKNYKKAEQLFKSVLSRLIAKGVSQDDLAVIHISIKIADVYHQIGDIEKAHIGYKFCLQHLENHLNKNRENEDVLQLLGLNLEKYASLLFLQSDYNNALKYFTQAYEISVKLNGEEHEQTVILLNDLGTISYMLMKYDLAIEYLSKAAELGKKLPEMVDIGSIYVNLGNTLIAKGLYDEAKQNCIKGQYLAKAKHDDDTLTEANKCLQLIKKVMH